MPEDEQKENAAEKAMDDVTKAVGEAEKEVREEIKDFKEAANTEEGKNPTEDSDVMKQAARIVDLEDKVREATDKCLALEAELAGLKDRPTLPQQGGTTVTFQGPPVTQTEDQTPAQEVPVPATPVPVTAKAPNRLGQFLSRLW